MQTANSQVTDYDAAGRPSAGDMATLSAPLTEMLTSELAGAVDVLGVSSDEILVAALGRTIERTIGIDMVAVDMPGYGTSVLSLALPCVPPAHTSATDLLATVHKSLAELAARRLVRGVLDDPRAQPLSDVLFAYDAAAAEYAHLGHVLELRAFHGPQVLQLEWCYDRRSFEPYTVQELAEQFPLALIEITSEAASPITVTTELALAR